MDITALVCTYNRRADVLELLNTLIAQETCGEFTYQVFVADNNSSDGTREAVSELAAQHPGLIHYIFEPRQGKSYALQTALTTIESEFLFVVDSDQLLPPEYLRTVVRTFRQHPDVSVVGGKVLPVWSGRVPSWLTVDHWAPLAMEDYGDQPFMVDPARPLCLLATSFRLADLRAAGGFRIGLSVCGKRIGGVEDAEIIERMLKLRYRAYYEPALYLHHKAEPNRLTKRYHRAWHTGHGGFRALLRDEAVENSRFQLFGVPGHMYRAMLIDAAQWIRCCLTGNVTAAFGHETKLRFFWGFLQERMHNRHSAAEGI